MKGLAEKAKLNEKHVRIARIYKAKVATLTSERAEVQGQVQHMTEEMERLKFDLKNTSSARAWAESREGEVWSSLRQLRTNFEKFAVNFRLCRAIWLRFERG